MKGQDEMENAVRRNIYTILHIYYVDVFMNGQMVRCCELWDGIFFSPFIKDALLREALKFLWVVFGELEQLWLWPPCRYIAQ